MPSLEAHIETERASRYLVHFCKHATAMGGRGAHVPRMRLHGAMSSHDVRIDAQWSDTEGTVTLTPWGRCVLRADENALSVNIEAADENGLREIRDIVTRDLDRFSRRDPLVVTWSRPGTDEAVPTAEAEGVASARRGIPRVLMSIQGIIVAIAGVLVLVLHLGLAGTFLSTAPWAGLAINAVLVIVVVKVALIAVFRFRFRLRRRRRAPKTSADAPVGEGR
ncbi:DUF2218 domain-containing protein [Sphaerisporangium sp. NPDC005289]|uniref:DUF2218 domain-containing protein n=1 Tax=Sphaerisporangium sp. NPDC005289 TaxID=3155247 RepID=UPI0033B7C5B3